MLSAEMIEIIDGYSAAVVATVTASGQPAASVKGTFIVEDGRHIAYGDIRSPGTRANLELNPSVEVVFTDVLSRRAVRVFGTAAVHDDAGDLQPLFEAAWGSFVHLMGRFVRITVERAEITVSPSYDIGLTRPELTDSTFQRLDALAHVDRESGPTSTNEFGQTIGRPLGPNPGTDEPSTAPMAGRFCELAALDAEAHAEDLFEEFAAAEDDSDWTYLPYGPFRDLESFTEWVHMANGLDATVFFAVLDPADKRALGVASYLRIEPGAATIEVGHIHFGPRLQRTPAATEAMHLMMARAFECGYRRYEWKCDDLNAPSRAAAKRLGFRYEGTFRQATHYKGRNRDTAWYSILDSEWARLDAEFVRWLDPANFDETGRQRTRLRTSG